MAVFTVHQPKPRKSEDVAPPERFAFVRDGFYFWAFVFGPLWMLWNRLWLVLVGYLALTAAIQAGLWALGVSGVVKFAVGFALALLVGLEAGTLRRWSLRRWTDRGIVVAYNKEAAEHRFFDRWSGESLPSYALTEPPEPPQGGRVPTSDHDVIGLFPEPQSRT